MSFEQPGYITVPPTRLHTKLAPYPRPDYSSRAYRSELPTAATDHCPKAGRKYLHGLYPKRTPRIAPYPTKSQIRKNLVKHSKADLNPPPADASGRLVHVPTQKPSKGRRPKAKPKAKSKQRQTRRRAT